MKSNGNRINGIICIETEWEHTKVRDRLSLDSRPLLEFVGKACDCEIIYRQVATKSELAYYLDRFSQAQYRDNKYPLFYFSFHGDTQSIVLEGEPKATKYIGLDELAELANGAFDGKIVHFGCCRTLLGSEENLRKFRKKTKATLVSGYTKSVDSNYCAFSDIAWFDQLNRHAPGTAKKNMEKLMKGMGEQLGFKVIGKRS